MIRYEPHPHWLPDILRLPVSYSIRRALYGTIGIGLYSTALIWLLETRLQVSLPRGATAFTVLGALMSLGLAFRVNNSYARWWEARLHWGLLVNHSRNLAALTEALWPREDQRGRRRMAGLVGDFAVGLSAHLRGELGAEELSSLAPEERAVALDRQHPLSYVSQLVWSEVELRRATGTLDTAQVLELQPHARALLDVLGACERIRATPIPFAVTSAVRAFLFVFSALLPLGLYTEFGWAAVLISMVAYFSLAVTDVLASELENPFGIDCNDLPTRSIGEMIRRQVHEIVGVEREGPPDTQPVKPKLYEKIR